MRLRDHADDRNHPCKRVPTCLPLLYTYDKLFVLKPVSSRSLLHRISKEVADPRPGLLDESSGADPHKSSLSEMVSYTSSSLYRASKRAKREKYKNHEKL